MGCGGCGPAWERVGPRQRALDARSRSAVPVRALRRGVYVHVAVGDAHGADPPRDQPAVVDGRRCVLHREVRHALQRETGEAVPHDRGAEDGEVERRRIAPGTHLVGNTSNVLLSMTAEPGQYQRPADAGIRSVHWCVWPPSMGRMQLGSWRTTLLWTEPSGFAELSALTVPTPVSLIHHAVRPSRRSAGT